MTDADEHGTAVSDGVVETTWNAQSQGIGAEIVIVDRPRLLAPCGARILEGADQFFLLGVHADDGQAPLGVAPPLLADMQELLIAAGTLAGCDLLAVDTEFVIHLLQ